MRLYEFESKQIFKNFRIKIPKLIAVLKSIDQIEGLELTFPVMVKAMVLIGGRGKAGGVKKASNLDELKLKAQEIFNLKIAGYSVDKILIEEAVEVVEEIYLSVTTDPATFDVVIVASASGGVDIEAVAKSNPDAIFTRPMSDNPMELPVEIISEVCSFLVSQNRELSKVEDDLRSVIASIFRTYQNIEAKTSEINPLILTTLNGGETLLAADAKIVLDDNSLYRHAPLLKSIGINPRSKRHDVSEQTIFEARGFKAGFQYLDLLEEPELFEKNVEKLYVGLVPGGAGYGIFSIDEVVNVGERYFNGNVVPINFMDSGGGPALGTVAEMFHLLMDHPATDLIITSRFGGISSCDIFIQGLIMALRDRYLSKKSMKPVFGRMVGTDLAAAAAYLERAKRETPKPLEDMHIIVGNQKIMADIIKDGIDYGFKFKANLVGGN
ncbi:MAG: ATP-grasp domain-containing protein [Candidatus Kariarchaeaceae archaeon]|jgi:succinyl-CoA synthetase beta subunit